MKKTQPTVQPKPQPADTDNKINTFFLDLRVLKALKHLASTSETRYVLRSVCVRLINPDLYYACATDGRLLGVYQSEMANEWTGKFPQEFIFPLDWLRFFPGSGWQKHTIVVDVPDNTGKRAFRITNEDGESYTQRFIEGNYPNYGSVLPDKPSVDISEYAFNPALANNFVKALSMLSPKYNGIVLRSHGVGEAYSILTECPFFYGVLMPTRQVLDRPAWVKDLIPKTVVVPVTASPPAK